MSDIRSLASEALDRFYDAFDGSYENLAYRSDCQMTESYLRNMCSLPLNAAGLTWEELPRTSYDEAWDVVQNKISSHVPPCTQLYRAATDKLLKLAGATERNELQGILGPSAVTQFIAFVKNGMRSFDKDNKLMFVSDVMDGLPGFIAHFENSEALERTLIREIILPVCNDIYRQFIYELSECSLSTDGKKLASGYMVKMKKQIAALENLQEPIPPSHVWKH